MSHSPQPMKDPRRAGTHVVAALDYLADLGITDVTVTKRKHLTISWRWGPGRMQIVTSCTPRSESCAERYVRQQIKRTIMKAVGE